VALEARAEPEGRAEPRERAEPQERAELEAWAVHGKTEEQAASVAPAVPEVPAARAMLVEPVVLTGLAAQEDQAVAVAPAARAAAAGQPSHHRRSHWPLRFHLTHLRQCHRRRHREHRR